MKSVDVAVIGAGVVGTSLAWELTVRGYTVAVVEKETVGAGASGRNAGSLVYPLDPRLQTFYDDSLAQIQRLGDTIVSAVRQVGMLILTEDVGEAGAVTRELGGAHPALAPEMLEPEEVSALEPSVAPGIAACRSSAAHCVDPRTLTTAFMDRARQAGATLVIGEGRLLVTNGRVTGVRMADDEISADRVVVCPGYAADDALREIGVSLPVGPIWGVIAELRLPRPPGHVLLEASAFRDVTRVTSAAVDTDHRAVDTIGFGLVTVDGVSALGHSLAPHRPSPMDVVPRLMSRAARYLPDVESMTIGPTRLCARPTSSDDLPILGAVPGYETCYVAAGHGGKGVTIGPGTTKLLADVMDGDAEVPAALDVRRFVPA